MNRIFQSLAFRLMPAVFLVMVGWPQIAHAGFGGMCVSGPNCGPKGRGQFVRRVRPGQPAGRIQPSVGPHRGTRPTLASARPTDFPSERAETPLRRRGSQALSLAVLVGGLGIVGWSMRKPNGRRGRKSRTMIPLCIGLMLAGHVIFAPPGWMDDGPPTVASADEALQSGEQFTSGMEIAGLGSAQIGGTATDPFGNLYVTGGFTGTLVFETVPKTVLTSTGDFDAYVAKYGPAGKCLWAREANGAEGLPAGLSLDGGVAIAADDRGNCYVGGGFVSKLTFKNAAKQPVFALTNPGSGLNIEAFVVKYAPDGTPAWAKGGGSGSPQQADSLIDGLNGVTGISLDRAGNPHLSGQASGGSFLGRAIQRRGKTDTVVARLNPVTGDPTWVSTAGGSGVISGMALALDASANTYTLGFFSEGNVTFPTQSPTTFTNTNSRFENVTLFLAKHDATGQCLSVQPITSSDRVLGNALAATDSGEVYVTGGFRTEANFGTLRLTNTADRIGGFAVKFGADGKPVWGREFGDDFAQGNRIVLDRAGNPHIAGMFEGNAVFGRETSRPQTLFAQNSDLFLLHYDASGAFQSVKGLSAAGTMGENLIFSEKTPVYANPVQLAYNPTSGELKIAGDFQGKLQLDNITFDSDDMDFDGDGDADDPDDDGEDGDGDDGDDGDGNDGDRWAALQETERRSGFVASIPTATAAPVEPPTVQFGFPKGGETFNAGDTLSIRWTSSDKVGLASHDLALSTDGGTTFAVNLVNGLPGTAQSFDYRIPASLAAERGRLRLTAANTGGKTAQDTTPADFKIEKSDTTAPTVSVTAPTAGATVESVEGARVAVAWTSRDDVGVTSHTVRLTGKRNGTQFTDTVASGLPGTTASFSIAVRRDDAVAEAQVVVEARDAAANRGEGKSGLFTIAAPRADTEKPVVSGVTLSKSSVKRKKDSTVGVAWQSSDNVGVAGHDLSFAADGNTFSTTVASGLSGSVKTFTWTIPESVPKTKTGRVKVVARDAAGNAGEAVSGTLSVK